MSATLHQLVQHVIFSSQQNKLASSILVTLVHWQRIHSPQRLISNSICIDFYLSL